MFLQFSTELASAASSVGSCRHLPGSCRAWAAGLGPRAAGLGVGIHLIARLRFKANPWKQMYTPLHLAAAAGSLGVCKLLLEKRSDLDARST